MSTLATWDNITGALGSTTTTFGGQWGNLVSDFFNGINLALTDPTKVPRINTLTRYKFEKLGLFDGDESHDVLFSVDDIDTGPTRKIKIRRMNTPFETDYMLLEGLPAVILNKTIDSDLNTITNIVNADIKIGAGITDDKLTQITNKTKLPNTILYNDQNNNLGAFYYDMAAIAAPVDPAVNAGRFYVKAIDINNDGVFCKIKRNGVFVETQIL